jgi:hypothetical protein
MLNKFLNTLFLNRGFNQKAALAFILCALLMTLCCGKRKPPLPPIEKVRQRVEISGFQRGNKIVLSWQMPARNASNGSILNIKSADVYRLAESLNDPQTLSEEEFANRSVLIGSLPISDADFGLKRLSYTDSLEFAGQSARLRYAIRFVNNSGQKAAFSNFLLIEPSAKVADNPKSLTASVSQESILLNWIAPQINVDGSKPVNILGYNVYRSDSKTDAGKLLNEKPVSDNRFRDEFFEFDKEYYYFVRSVSVGNSGEPLESAESNIVEILPKDTFAPTAPTSITVAAVPGNISIFFASNPEKDIAGYSIYRSTDDSLEKSRWQLLTKDLLKTNTFQDTKTESGVKYFYYLTATDARGNISESSEIVSETAP